MHVNAVSYYVVINFERGSRVWSITTGRWWVYVHLSVTSTTTTPTQVGRRSRCSSVPSRYPDVS